MTVVLESYRDDPVGFVQEVLGDAPYAKQREMLETVVHNRRVSVVGANGSGKDWAAARAVLWWIATRPRATVVVTGPTQRQVEEIVWRELRGAYKASRIPLGGRVSGSHWNIDDDRFAIGFSTNRPENLQGFHSPELLVVVTEAHAVPQGHMEALKRLIPARMLLTGNAFSRDGEFFDSHHTKRHLYTRIAISAFDTPNFTGENGGIPGAPTEEDVEERKLDWGEDHPLYQGSVLARFPDMLDDSLIGRTVIEQAVERWEQYYGAAGGGGRFSEHGKPSPPRIEDAPPLPEGEGGYTRPSPGERPTRGSAAGEGEPSGSGEGNAGRIPLRHSSEGWNPGSPASVVPAEAGTSHPLVEGGLAESGEGRSPLRHSSEGWKVDSHLKCNTWSWSISAGVR